MFYFQYDARKESRAAKTLEAVNFVTRTSAIKDLIDDGPPDGFLTRFVSIFGEKSAQTEKDVASTLAELGW